MTDQATTPEGQTQQQPPEDPFNPLILLSKGGAGLAELWIAKSAIDIYREVVAAVLGGLDPKTDDAEAAAKQYVAQLDLAHVLGIKAVNRQLLFIQGNVQGLLFGEGRALPELVAFAQLAAEGRIEEVLNGKAQAFAEEQLRELRDGSNAAIGEAVTRNNAEWNTVLGRMKEQIEKLTTENAELAKQLADKLSSEPPPGLPPAGDPPVVEQPKPRAKASK
jgi:hypothetical protein